MPGKTDLTLRQLNDKINTVNVRVTSTPSHKCIETALVYAHYIASASKAPFNKSLNCDRDIILVFIDSCE